MKDGVKNHHVRAYVEGRIDEIPEALLPAVKARVEAREAKAAPEPEKPEAPEDEPRVIEPIAAIIPPWGASE